jgi:hypothetical protein
MSPWEAMIPVAMFIVFAAIVKFIVDSSTRKKLIEKGLVDEKVKHLFPDKPKVQPLSSLKWGLVCIGIGIALFIGRLAPYDLREEITIGAMFVLAGLGLVIYYPIASRRLKKSKEENEQGQSTS